MTDHWDMDHPQVDITPNKAAGIIIHVSRLIKTKIEEFEELNDESAKAKKKAEVTFARAYLGAVGPQEEKRQIAMLAAADARFDADVAERKVKACAKALDSLSEDLDAARTISATARDEMK